jgi:hypothetical protein
MAGHFTAKARWKDLRTDLMIAPAGLNPEYLVRDFKEEVQVSRVSNSQSLLIRRAQLL